MNIVLYTPYLQGFYIGELVNQIRQLCQLKHYCLTIIRTGSFGIYNTRLGLSHADGVIVIRDAIAADLMEFIVKNNIACVSVAYDYFPLDIPVLTSNHQLGIQIAFDHLESQSASDIAFIGEISQYDQRKRLEYYTQEIESRGYEFNEDNIINTNSSLIEGGHLAAERFLEKNGSANGIIFSAGLVGIGFVQHLQTLNPEKLEQLSLICFDAIPLIPVLAPQLAAVDQNLHLIAYRAINRLEKSGDIENRKVLVDPKLTKLSNDEAIDFDPFLTTCVEMAELYTPGYMKSVIANQHDLPREIAESELDTIASLSTLFPNFFCSAQALRYHLDQKGNEWVKLFKNITRDKLEKLPASDKASLLPLTEYRPNQKMASQPRCNVYIPIYVEQRLWGYLLVFGESYDQYDKSSFLSFTAFLDEIVILYQKDVTIKILKNELSKRKHVDSALPDTATPINDNDGPLFGEIIWSVESRESTWNQDALNILGFESDVEQFIYRNMDISDRAHDDDQDDLREAIYQATHKLQEQKIQAQYKIKSGNFEPLELHIYPEVVEDKLTQLTIKIHKSDVTTLSQA